MDKKEILKFYVEMVNSILNIYNLNKNNTTEKITKRILNWIIREYKGKINLYASQKAISLTKGKDLSEYNWKDQVKSIEKGGLGDAGRKKLHIEHILPISQIIKNLFNAKTKDEDEIEKILNEISVAWITKEEQKELDKKNKINRGINLDESLSVCETVCEKLKPIGEYKVPLIEDEEE